MTTKGGYHFRFFPLFFRCPCVTSSFGVVVLEELACFVQSMSVFARTLSWRLLVAAGTKKKNEEENGGTSRGLSCQHWLMKNDWYMEMAWTQHHWSCIGPRETEQGVDNGWGNILWVAYLVSGGVLVLTSEWEKEKKRICLRCHYFWRTNSTDGVLTVCFQHEAMDLAIYHEVGRTDFWFPSWILPWDLHQHISYLHEKLCFKQSDLIFFSSLCAP